MATWDVFHSDRLEVERGLSTDEVRAALARGDVRDDDLVRPSGTTTPWAPIVDMPALVDEPEFEPEVEPATPDDADVLEVLEVIDDDGSEVEVEAVAPHAAPVLPEDEGVEFDSEYDLNLDRPGDRASSSLEVIVWDDDLDGDAVEEFDPQEEDEAAAEFTLSRGSAERVEEVDLAAMVDVAFQLVLFFLVTATTVLYKSLEVPKPNPENNPPAAAAQGKSKSLDDLKETYILVEIDPAGAVKVDSEPIPAEMSALVERLRSLRERTGRKAMLLSADFTTPHRSAVLAYDAANEIGLGIAIARPKPGPPARGG